MKIRPTLLNNNKKMSHISRCIFDVTNVISPTVWGVCRDVYFILCKYHWKICSSFSIFKRLVCVCSVTTRMYIKLGSHYTQRWWLINFLFIDWMQFQHNILILCGLSLSLIAWMKHPKRPKRLMTAQAIFCRIFLFVNKNPKKKNEIPLVECQIFIRR